MKKIVVLFVGVFASALTFAETPSPKSVSGMTIVRKDAYSFKLIYKSEEATDVKVEIFNNEDKLVFSEVIRRSNGFARPYNFEKLAEGEYTIKLDNGSNWMTETVNYSSGRTPKLAQVVKISDGKYMLTVPGRGEDELSVSIFDQEGKVIYKDATPVYDDFSQVYDMGNLKGPFSFEVSDKGGISTMLKRK